MGHDLDPRLLRPRALVAIDLPGFGQSERRAELLSPRAMGRFLLRLIDEWELGHPHVVRPRRRNWCGVVRGVGGP